MEDLLFRIEITPQLIYLSLILLVIGNGLKDVPYIPKWVIIWILMVISISVQFVFVGITFQSLFEAIMASSLSTMIYQLYKQTKKGVTRIKERKEQAD